MPKRYALLLVALFLIPAPSRAQKPAAPPPPDKFRIYLRYHIPAPRDQHVMQYDEMVKQLKGADFEFDPPLNKRPQTDREDRTKNYLKGYVKPDKLLLLLLSRMIMAILAIPEDFEQKLPAKSEDPVHVHLELTGGLAIARQRELWEQVKPLLRQQGFIEAVGYDNRGYTGQPFTRLSGTVPVGQLQNLLKDLRTQPDGWFSPLTPVSDLPMPLKSVNPIRLIEVLPDLEPIKQSPDPEPRNPDYLQKLSPDLWELAGGKEPSAKPVRVQVIFTSTSPADDRNLRKALAETAPGLYVEGRLGQYVTGVVPANQLKALAALSEVSTIRLPRLTHVGADPDLKWPGDTKKALDQSGVAALHKRGAMGVLHKRDLAGKELAIPIRVGVIDTDFRGWQELVKAGKLPKRTTLVDLTAERAGLSADHDALLVPAAYPGEADKPGHGTICAQAAALAAPDAEFVLIRTDALDPFQLREIAAYIQGGEYSPLIEKRRDELAVERAGLLRQRAELLAERKRILGNFNDETELKDALGFLGPVFGWLYSERDWHHARMRQQEKDEAEMDRLDRRMTRFLAEVDSLRGIQVVINPLVWSDGYPLGNVSPFSRWLDTPDAKRPLWFQSVGNKRGQSWQGEYRTSVGQSVLEFAPAGTKLVKGHWTTELNFLTWKPHLAEAKPELPEKTQLRLTLQWREPHDADYYRPGREDGKDDWYRRPLADVKLILLRQRDPEAKALYADEFEVVAQTSAIPQRLEHYPDGSVYEHVLDVTLDKAGRYALRIERQPESRWIYRQDAELKRPGLVLLTGLTPTGIRPLGSPTLPELERNWELRPRVFVETMSADKDEHLKGRTVFGDFSTDPGTIGIPADATGAISVGAANLKDEPQPYSTAGPPSNLELARRPTVLAYDALQLEAGTAYGSSVATAFAGGTAAALLGTGLTPEQVAGWFRAHAGRVMKVPAAK